MVPGIRHIVTNMESKLVLGAILRGGFYDASRLPDDLLTEFRRVGRRCDYSAVMRSLFGAMSSFVAAQDLYERVSVPVTLVYGDKDWAKRRQGLGETGGAQPQSPVGERLKGHYTR